MRLLRSTLPMALGLSLPPLAVSAEPAPPAPLYRELRPQLLEALGSCTSPQPLERCEPASQQLQDMIRVSELPAAREQRPRCLGALTLLETHLTVFRWGLEPRQQLQTVIQQLEQDCPPPRRAAQLAT
jgi:hypothetical protein